MSENTPDRVETAAEELYGLAPDDFVPVRDELVAAAREAGDRDAARAIARLRRPTQAAWLANLLARERATQLDGLLSLAADLGDAQRTLDGAALRALSVQRGKLVAAMAREARALAGRDGHKIAESTERDLRGILDAALADPDIAEQVRSGRLHRTVSYSGFGPDALAGAEPRPAPRRRPGPEVPAAGADTTGTADDPWAMPDDAAARAEQERRARELADARRALDDARSTADEARTREEAERRAHEEAERRLADAKARVADLAAELEQARGAQRDATEAERSAAAELRDAAARTRAAAADVERAQAKVADLS
ncbi:hypothetical protein [Pseudonocardia sp.]|uniref:hypothetical protein n=1 Tax=Pseudonocardia sp. TaxID=60912 RepID=UPI003D14EF09